MLYFICVVLGIISLECSNIYRQVIRNPHNNKLLKTILCRSMGTFPLVLHTKWADFENISCRPIFPAGRKFRRKHLCLVPYRSAGHLPRPKLPLSHRRTSWIPFQVHDRQRLRLPTKTKHQLKNKFCIIVIKNIICIFTCFNTILQFRRHFFQLCRVLEHGHLHASPVAPRASVGPSHLEFYAYIEQWNFHTSTNYFIWLWSHII